MSKNVAVFVDVANIFYAAKAAGVDIDYVTLLKTASAGRDLVRAYAYTGLDPDNENQRNFHDFLRRHGYKVVSKDIRKYGDGKVKANLDIELVVDMMKTARNLDIAIVISGDGDFAPAIRAVQEMGVRVEVISFRGNTSSDLIEVADLFTEITQIARVEKGSSRSGRRVAEDEEEDLSMTEVPDKQSEGTGTRGRGRGRSRTRTPDGEAAVAVTPAPRSRSRARVVEPEVPAVAAVTSGGMSMVVMPGEKLSRVAAAVAPAVPVVPVAPVATSEDAEEFEELVDGELPAEGDGEDGPRRRRRRRGGRGRGRGRGRDETGTPVEGGVAAGAGEVDAVDTGDIEDDEPEDEIAPRPGPAKRSTHTFGSVWDSQIGVPSGTPIPAAASGPIDLDDDLDEPPIPEYLIAERNRGSANRGTGLARGGRGTRSSYASAVDRERYGGARGATPPRFAEPTPRGDGPRSGGGRGGDGSRGGDRFRADRPAPRAEGRPGSSNEPWSEVPPEIEAMLRAQLGTRNQRPLASAPAPAPRPTEPAAAEAVVTAPPRRRPVRKAGSAAEPASVESQVAPASGEALPAAPKRRAPRKPAEAAPAAVPTAATSATAETVAPKRRTTRKAAEVEPAVIPAAEAAPKRRSTREQAPAADA